MPKTLVISTFLVDSESLTRSGPGAVSIDGTTHHYQLDIITASGDGQWLVETWRKKGESQAEGPQHRIVAALDEVLADISLTLAP